MQQDSSAEKNRAKQIEVPAANGAPDAPAVPLFKIHDATVVRAGKTILHVDDFSLAEGEHVALLGPNGAGKSTFIQLLTREVQPLWHETPAVLFRGQARPLLRDVRQTMGVVSSTMHDQVRVHLPVLQIVIGGLYGTLGLPMGVRITDSDKASALDALDRLGIADLAKRDIMTLSTGQVRRVLVARELIRDPQVLVFDEPCTGLDPEGMYHVRETMSTLAAEGRSVILVTHYPEDIIPAIKRVMLIKSAAIFADGPKEEILRDEVLSNLFEVPLHVGEQDGWYSLRGVYEG
ncbi:MAG: ABC transporter ATP-binding protein [Tractidigestivibacter sp.]|jgi:ABC-type molybdenum transport system ATPase subunit/photorepair protein PhrA|uniref:ABC transporter ATP-binding protein n=1 Tax=Tractidigestivibacter sp. TaxID=2847320 RepID=UPI003D94B154